MKKQRKKPSSGLDERRVQQVFHALAAPPRRAMLKYLSASSLTAGEISSRFDMAKPSVSQHLSILETAGLVSREKRGQYVHYALVRPTVEAALSSYLAELGILPPPPVAEPEEQAPATAPARKAKSAPAVEPEPIEKPAPAQMSMF